ncbi:MAG: serine hydrolase [Anaerolineae bacterium]|nr:serine hydrolase [Anaerolineae bacterium]
MQRSFTFVLLLVVLFACIGPLAAQDAVVWPTTEWPTSTPEEQGMDSARLLEFLSRVEERNLGLDNLTVIRNGHVVLDANWYPYTPDTPHQLYSATKSVVSLLAGIALDQGIIESLDQPILDFFPGRTIANLNDEKLAATVGDVLTMNYWLACLNNGEATYEAMHNAPDTIQPILDVPVGVPGMGINYCDLTPHLMLGALQESLGRPVLEYAHENLLQPMGITDYIWRADSAGVPFGGYDLYLTPHDAARIGYLALRNGDWNGQQIVSPEWIETSTCADPAQCPFYDSQGYGYYWWMLPPDFYSAIGLAGQYIAVSPDHGLVVIALTNGREGTKPYSWIPYLLNQDLVGTVVSDEPLPANPEVVAELDARLESIANPPAPQTAAPIPEAVMALSGVTYGFEEPLQLWPEPAFMAEERFGFPMGAERFTLTFDAEEEATLDLAFSDGYTASLTIGLDGVPRLNDTRFGPLAASGSWLPGAQVGLTMDLDFIGQGDTQTLTFRMSNGRMRVIWHDGALGVGESTYAQPEPGS